MTEKAAVPLSTLKSSEMRKTVGRRCNSSAAEVLICSGTAGARMRPLVVVVSGPPALRAASPVPQLGGVCRAGCAADNNAASRTLSQTHIPVGLLLLVEVAVVVVGA